VLVVEVVVVDDGVSLLEERDFRSASARYCRTSVRRVVVVCLSWVEETSSFGGVESSLPEGVLSLLVAVSASSNARAYSANASGMWSFRA